jgi:2-phosphosulfolactate phosphatase
MPEIDVVLMPKYLRDSSLLAKTVIVFDVLRATTTIVAALAARIRSVRAFANLDEAMAAARANPDVILCGEMNALPAPGVDMGNSPGQFRPEHAGRDVFLCTTNGTKALNAARSAAALYAGALVNAEAVAIAAGSTDQDMLLLGSGTNGDLAMEDAIGAGAVCDRLLKIGKYSLANDAARMAHRLFLASRGDLPRVLRDCQGGRNVIRAGLEADIDFAARLDVFDIAPMVDRENLVIHRWP